MTEQALADAFERIECLLLDAVTADGYDEAVEKVHDADAALEALRRQLLVGDPSGLDRLRERRVHAIASALDHPSVYASGPRVSSLRTAERVMEALETVSVRESA
ncbi:hypothetical protein B2G69_07720 [Methylorubrum zatmanii]|nr:hypothetical protein [Methylorubrum zatmanii]ARO54043.1 hypothetical protein B2G69_07720 [Methylorubrum zatmanii]